MGYRIQNYAAASIATPINTTTTVFKHDHHHCYYYCNCYPTKIELPEVTHAIAAIKRDNIYNATSQHAVLAECVMYSNRHSPIISCIEGAA